MAKSKHSKLDALRMLAGHDPDADRKIDTIPTGHPELDFYISRGMYENEHGETIEYDEEILYGLPSGKLVMFYGGEGCLSGNSFIRYSLCKEGKMQNDKGGTIEKLYHRFNNIKMKGKGSYQRPQTKESEFYAPCMNEDGRIFMNRIQKVIKTGNKPCFEICTKSGLSLIATEDHKLWTGTSYKEISEIRVGDPVFIHNNTRWTSDMEEKEFALVGDSENTYRKYLYVKSHGVAGIKKTDGYAYHRLARSRAVIESQMNNMSFDEYIDCLNNRDISNLIFLRKDQEVHHIDEDITNDDIDNLIALDSSEHARGHALDRHNNLRFVAVEDTVESISSIENQDTYDISMESPYSNYIANNFVVHNCGKSSLAYRICGNAQQMDKPVFWIDCENSFSPQLAKINGMDPDNIALQNMYDVNDVEKIFSAETILDTVMKACASGAGVVVVDSVANLIPKYVLDNPADKETVAILARVLGRTLPKIASYAAANGTLVIFINQLRVNPGQMFGNPEGTTGGNAIKHACSVILKMNKLNSKDSFHYIEDESGEETLIAGSSNVWIDKNRFAIPHKKGVKIPIYYLYYFPNANEVIFEYGRKTKNITVRKGVYSWEGIKIEGKNEFMSKAHEDNRVPELIIAIEASAKEAGIPLPPEITNYDKHINFGKNNDVQKGKSDDFDPNKKTTKKKVNRKKISSSVSEDSNIEI